MIKLRPCKHLDYTPGKFGPDIELKTCAPHYPDVRYWQRGASWTDNGAGQQPNPAKVQFCGAGRGRINGIFQCYNGDMPCYEPAPSDPECVACWWTEQRDDPLVHSIHENEDGTWTVHNRDGSRGATVRGTVSNDPRQCTCQ